MKQKLQKRMTRLLTALLVVAVTVCFVPQTGTPVYAANGDPAMVAGAESVLKATANTDNAQTVWYAGKAWRVISFDGTGNGYTKQSGAMTLFSSDFLASNTQFNSNWQAETANDYAGSDLQNTVNDLYDSLFSTEEKEAVNNRTLSVGEYTSSYPYSTGISGTATSGYLWALSTAEAFALPTMTFRSAETDWWLRSPGGADYYTAIVYYDGIVSHSGYNVNYEYGARPAFYLNLSSVLFTSAAEGGKSSGTVGAESLTAVLTNSNSEWKVTLLDSGRSGFAVSDITPTATGVSLKYSGAKTGTNEYVSAVIMDSSDTIKYYGRVKACAADADTSDTIEIKTDGILGEDDKLYVFNEQYNGDKMTDYASELVPVAKDYTKNWGGSGSENDPYVISNTEGWNDLAEFVAAGGNTEGIYFAMGDDISVTESVGTGATPFAGVFDGKGHTLTFNKTATGQSCAPFSVTSNAAFRNLHIDGSIETNHKFAGGLIGTANGSNTVTNCRSSIVILSSIDGDGTHGGFVGRNNVTYEGCVFDGKIIGEKTTSCGAFQGWNSDDSKCTNCISDASEMNTYLTGGTFIRNGSETNLTNCYYMQPIGQGRDHGKQAYSVIASNGVSIGFGEGTKYDVSGITAYSTGLEYKGVFYAGKEEQIDLTMPDLSSQRNTTSRAQANSSAAEQVIHS